MLTWFNTGPESSGVGRMSKWWVVLSGTLLDTAKVRGWTGHPQRPLWISSCRSCPEVLSPSGCSVSHSHLYAGEEVGADQTPMRFWLRVAAPEALQETEFYSLNPIRTGKQVSFPPCSRLSSEVSLSPSLSLSMGSDDTCLLLSLSYIIFGCPCVLQPCHWGLQPRYIVAHTAPKQLPGSESEDNTSVPLDLTNISSLPSSIFFHVHNSGTKEKVSSFPR